MRATFRRPVSPLSARHPFSELDQLWRELDRWAGTSRRAPRRPVLDTRPRVTREEDADTWMLRAPLPGVSADRLEVTVQEGVLSIVSTVSSTDDDGFTVAHRERQGPQRRIRWTLPEHADLDSIDAALTDGWLQVTVARKAPPTPRTIAVRAG